MFAFIVRRILVAIPTLILFSFAMFMVLYASGDPIARLRGTKIDADTVNKLIQDNGFNDPWYERYWSWVTGFVQGDWGTSFAAESSAYDEIMSKLPATIELLAVALIVTLVVAVPLGVFSATKRYSTFDNLGTGFSYLGFATPTFFVGLMLQLLVVGMKNNGWGLPIFGLGLLMCAIALVMFFQDRRRWVGIAVGLGVVLLGAIFWSVNVGEQFLFTQQRFTPFLEEQSIWSVDHLRHLILPVITITVISIATWSRYLRSSMLDVLSQDYLRTARAKGVSERTVVFKHALRNGTLPLITILAIDAALFFQGAVITETVFSWNGIGSRLIQAVREQDIPVSMGIVMIGALMVVLFNIIADIAYSIADPRIRLA